MTFHSVGNMSTSACYTLRQGRCIPYEHSLNDKSIVFKKSQRISSLSIRNFGSNTKPTLYQETKLFKNKLFFAAKPGHETHSIPDQYDHHVSHQVSVTKKLVLLYKFCRPYALVGTVIGVLSFSLLPLETISQLSLEFLVEVLKVLVCAVLINIYLIGMNDIFDVEIDKINKPYLPLSSGEMSLATAVAITAITGTVSVAMGLLIGSNSLLFLILTYLFIGGAYSIHHPLLRWKKNAFLAAFSMMVLNGVAIPFGTFMHIQEYVLRKPIIITSSFIISTTLALVFLFVIAIFKDVPDLDGDKAFGMKNFAILFGKERVFSFSTSLLMLVYGAVVVKGITLTSLPMKLLTILGHSGLAFLLWSRSQAVNLSDNKSTSSFYSFVWKLHCAECVLIHFIR